MTIIDNPSVSSFAAASCALQFCAFENIGYIDVNFVEDHHVPQMFAELANTRTIIFDMRGYPRSFFVEMVHRVSVTGSSITSELRVPYIVGGEFREMFWRQEIGRRNVPIYQGKTFMLIDERAQSAAEHFALALESIAGTKFVGSSTSGSNGNITYGVVPGGNYMTFTGMDVRHADGRQLQRVGILPDFEVRPTIAGVAAGRDEVLERAVELALTE